MNIKLNVSKEDYIKMPGLSRSGIVKFLDGPDAYELYTKENKVTDAMKFGTWVHDAFLNPEYFAKNYICAPEGMKFNNKDGIEFKKANTEKEIIKFDQMEKITSIVKKLKEHPTVIEIMEGAIIEPCASWTQDGVTLKTMPDIINEKLSIVADLKTIDRIVERRMQHNIKDHGYDIQGAMALDAFPFKKFVLIFVSTKKPHRVYVRQIRTEDIQVARVKYTSILPAFKTCLEHNYWPSPLPTDIVPIDLPLIDMEPVDDENEVY